MATTLGSHSASTTSPRGLGTSRFDTWRQFFAYALSQSADWIRQYVRSGKSPPKVGRPSNWRTKLLDRAEQKEQREEQAREPKPYLIGLPEGVQKLPDALLHRSEALGKLAPRIWAIEISEKALSEATSEKPEVVHNSEITQLEKPLEEWRQEHTLLIVKKAEPTDAEGEAIQRLYPIRSTLLSDGRTGTVVWGRTPAQIQDEIDALSSLVDDVREVGAAGAAHTLLFGQIPEGSGNATGAGTGWLLAGAAAALFLPMVFSGSNTEPKKAL